MKQQVLLLPDQVWWANSPLIKRRHSRKDLQHLRLRQTVQRGSLLGVDGDPCLSEERPHLLCDDGFS
jgi:hypothetical protein